MFSTLHLSPITHHPLLSSTHLLPQVWVATDDRRILFYSASDPERGTVLGRSVLPADPLCLVYHCGQVPYPPTSVHPDLHP